MGHGRLALSLLDREYAVCRLDPEAPIPGWALDSPFFSVTRTSEELSVVCLSGDVPSGVKSEHGWRVFMLHGPFDFGLTGILNSVTRPLADAGVAIFALSTFDTDYLLVKQADLETTVQALAAAGHSVAAS